MNRPSGVPILTLLDAGEAVFRTRAKFRFVFGWAFATSVWLVLVATLFVLQEIVGPGLRGSLTGLWIFVAVLGGVLFVVLGPQAMVYAWTGSKALESFLKDFFPLWFKLKLEMLPSSGGTVEERLLARLQALIPQLKRSSVGMNAQIPGKSGIHHFSIIARSRAIPGPPMGPPHRLALVQRFDHLVTRGDLVKLKEDAQDVVKKTGYRLYLLVALGRDGFDPEAIAWARGDEGLPTRGITSALVSYTDEGFTVAWAG